jgi:hypothetical protein
LIEKNESTIFWSNKSKNCFPSNSKYREYERSLRRSIKYFNTLTFFAFSLIEISWDLTNAKMTCNKSLKDLWDFSSYSLRGNSLIN